MCDNILSTRSLETLPALEFPVSSTDSNETLARREDSLCVYGLPEVTVLPRGYIPIYQSPWLLFVFLVAAVFSVTRIRRNGSSVKA